MAVYTDVGLQQTWARAVSAHRMYHVTQFGVNGGKGRKKRKSFHRQSSHDVYTSCPLVLFAYKGKGITINLHLHCCQQFLPLHFCPEPPCRH